MTTTQQPETPTPETDAQAYREPEWSTAVVVPVEFARRLERERDELRNYLDAAHYGQCNQELRAEVARLRGLLDWATNHCVRDYEETREEYVARLSEAIAAAKGETK